MISARQDIASATKESISEWGFSIILVYPDGKKIMPKANGRKASTDIDSEGVPIINNNPYLSISVSSLEGNTIPDKGCMVKTPSDFFAAGEPSTWWAVQRASKSDNDWFVKIYLTETEQEVTA